MAKSSRNRKKHKGLDQRGGRQNPPGGRPHKEVRIKEVEQKARDVRDAAALILRMVDKDQAGEVEAWRVLLQHKDPQIRLKSRTELSRLAYPVAKPVDAQVAGSITVVFRGPSPKWVKDQQTKPGS